MTLKLSRIRVSIGFVLLLALLAPLCRADFKSDVNAILANNTLKKAAIGIEIARLTPTEAVTVFKLNEQSPRLPASNLKILTTSAALDRLGPDFKFRTVLASKDADLYLIGDGDPTFGDAKLLKPLGWDVNTVFKSWAQELKKRGSTTVRNVIVDDSIFDTRFVHPNWPSEQQHFDYVAQVGGVNLNTNCLDIYVRATSPGNAVEYIIDPPTKYVRVKNSCVTGSKNSVYLSRVLGGNEIVLRGEVKSTLAEPVAVTIHDPPMFAATVLAETLAANGITVTGKVSRDRKSRDAQPQEIAALETPLASVLARANKDSVNMYAESLCKRLGYAASKEPGSWTNGSAAVAAFLKQAGADEKQFHLDDGCGLSRENGVSADVVIKVLEYNFRGKNFETFKNSLAIGGTDGTLKNRFEGSLKGRVFGKSGFINAVSCLSGYLKTTDDHWYAFSFLMNDVTREANPKLVHEKILTILDREKP